MTDRWLMDNLTLVMAGVIVLAGIFLLAIGRPCRCGGYRCVKFGGKEEPDDGLGTVSAGPP